MYTLKVTHQPEKRDYWQFMAILDLSCSQWKLSRWERGVSHIFRVDTDDIDAMEHILRLYDIPFINTHI